jgi:IS4 transposase
LIGRNIERLTAAKEMNLPKRLEKGSIVVFDRAYIDYRWWKQLDDDGIFFVSRTKSNQSITKVGPHTKEKETFVLADDIVLVGEYSGLFKYPKTMRRVKYYDKEKDKVSEYLTNNFDLNALEIARIYKDRWQIELFFKWVKQNLKIKTFLGTSYNAVMTQVWIAMIYYLLLAYVKFQTRFTKSLLELTRMVKETLFVRRPLIDLLSLSTTTLSRFKPPPHIRSWGCLEFSGTVVSS